MKEIHNVSQIYHRFVNIDTDALNHILDHRIYAWEIWTQKYERNQRAHAFLPKRRICPRG